MDPTVWAPVLFIVLPLEVSCYRSPGSEDYLAVLKCIWIRSFYCNGGEHLIFLASIESQTPMSGLKKHLFWKKNPTSCRYTVINVVFIVITQVERKRKRGGLPTTFSEQQRCTLTLWHYILNQLKLMQSLSLFWKTMVAFNFYGPFKSTCLKI